MWKIRCAKPSGKDWSLIVTNLKFPQSLVSDDCAAFDQSIRTNQNKSNVTKMYTGSSLESLVSPVTTNLDICGKPMVEKIARHNIQQISYSLA